MKFYKKGFRFFQKNTMFYKKVYDFSQNGLLFLTNKFTIFYFSQKGFTIFCKKKRCFPQQNLRKCYQKSQRTFTKEFTNKKRDYEMFIKKCTICYKKVYDCLQKGLRCFYKKVDECFTRKKKTIFFF